MKFKNLFIITGILLLSACSKETAPQVDPDPAELVKISEAGIKFVGETTNGALITLQMYSNTLKLFLDNSGMYPDGALDSLNDSCLNTVKFGIVINGAKVNDSTIDITCPVAETPPTDEERLDFGWGEDQDANVPDNLSNLICQQGGGIQLNALRDLTDLPVIKDSIRYCIGSDKKTYQVKINKLAGLGLDFPTRFNFLNRTVNGIISIIDTGNKVVDLIIKEL